MLRIHPTAIVDGAVTLGDGATVGPYAIIRGPVVVGRCVVVDAHSVVEGPAEIGDDCRKGRGADVGGRTD